MWEALLSALTVGVGLLRGRLGAPWLPRAVLTDRPIAQLVLLVGGREEIINQAHSKHGDACLLHQHGTGPRNKLSSRKKGEAVVGKHCPAQP